MRLTIEIITVPLPTKVCDNTRVVYITKMAKCSKTNRANVLDKIQRCSKVQLLMFDTIYQIVNKYEWCIYDLKRI